MINIKSDSRQVKPGDTFIALKGITSDGHDYIKTAIKNGATTIVAEYGDYSVNTIIVDDTRVYLEQYLLDQYKNILDDMKIIGITGTNGKTTVSYLLYQAFNLFGQKTAYAGTIGFFIDKKIKDLPNTTPDIIDIFNMIVYAYNQGCKIMVLEVSSHALFQRRVQGILFDYAIFTNLTKDHLDYHDTMENYAQAKLQLFNQLKPTGIALINNDDSYKERYLVNGNKNITFGFSNSDYQIVSFESDGQTTKFEYSHDDNKYTINTELLGKHNVYNLTTVISLLTEYGVDPKITADLIVRLKAPSGRMENIAYNINNIIIDYAHTPDAISNIIDAVKESVKGDIYVVFGCTGDRDRGKRPIMTDIVTSNAKYTIITNDDPHNEDPNQIVADMLEGITKTNYEVILDRKQAIIKGINLLEENDTLLILGKGHEEFMIIGNDKIPFNDRKVVTEYLKTKE